MAEPNILTADRVDAIFDTCMFKRGEPTEGHIAVEGIRANFGLHPGRINEHAGEILLMLKELLNEFMETDGGGWSFLNAGQSKHGTQWTRLHQTIEKLCVLGIAAGKAKWQMPKVMWSVFPGDMPYVVVLDKEKERGN